jgi:hypothetical protein
MSRENRKIKKERILFLPGSNETQVMSFQERPKEVSVYLILLRFATCLLKRPRLSLNQIAPSI